MVNFLNALGFLTIIKIPKKYYLNKNKLSGSLIYFPLVGLFVGIIIGIFYIAANYVLPQIIVVILTVGLEIIITGAIHFDGIADTFDGVFSGTKDKEKILRIMKKSDIGMFGVIIILFIIILKIGFLWCINWGDNRSLIEFFTVIVFMPVFGRWSMTYTIAKYEPVKKIGSLSGAFYSANNKKMFTIASIYTAFLFIAANIGIGLWFWQSLEIEVFNIALNGSLILLFYILKGIILIFVIYVIVFLTAKFLSKRVGGMNGDTIGSVCLITEVSYLFINCLLVT